MIQKTEELVITQTSKEELRRCILTMPFQQWPAPCIKLPMTVAAPINPFMSRGQKITHILRARVRATVALAICFFFLSSSLFFRKRPEFFAPSSCEKTNLSLCHHHHHIDSHSGTGSDTTRDNLPDHMVLIVKNGKVVLSKFNMLLQPFYQRTNITDSVHSTFWHIPKYRQKSSLQGSISSILPPISSGSHQLRVPHTYEDKQSHVDGPYKKSVLLLLFFYRRAERAWKHCRSPIAV